MGSSSSSQYAFSHVETGKGKYSPKQLCKNVIRKKTQTSLWLGSPLFVEGGIKIMVLLSTYPSICSLEKNSRCPLQFCLNVCLQSFYMEAISFIKCSLF